MMKATINELWDTGREIITFDDSDTDRPKSMQDLKKATNVLIGGKFDGSPAMYEVLIDSTIYVVMPNKVRHPFGGTMYILEVI